MKKASLSLSVNAIVILILAITMLGLGLGFIRGMFSKVSTQFSEMIDSESEPPASTGSEPITLSRETILTHSGDTEVLKVSVYNVWGNGTSGGAPSATNFDCSLITQSAAGTVDTANYKVSDTANDDDACLGVKNGAATALCGGVTGGTANPCDTTGAATACTDVVASNVLAGFASVWAIDANNFLKCEGIGCGASDGTHCTDTGAGPTSTGGDAVEPTITCSNPAFSATIATSLQKYEKSIVPGKSATFALVFDTEGAGKGTNLCKVSITQGYEKDFTIRITS